MYEKTKSSTTFKLPECCCSCLGPAHKRLMIVQAKEWTEEGVKYRQSYDIDVPICASCKGAVYRRRLIGVGLFLVSAAAAWLVWQQEWNEWEIWTAIGIVIAGLVGWFYFWFEGLPAGITDSGRPFFRNGEYERRFEDLNGLPPLAQ